MTVAFNLSVTVIYVCFLVECTIGSSRRATLITIEGEIQPTTAAATRCRFKVTSKVNMESSVRVLLHEGTVLREKEIFTVLLYNSEGKTTTLCFVRSS